MTQGETARLLAGLGASAWVAAAVRLALQGRNDHVVVVSLCVAAVVLALLRRPFGGSAAWTVVLGALVLAALPYGRGPWPALLAGVGVGSFAMSALVARFGNRAALVTALLVGLVVGGAALRAPERPRFPVHTWSQFHYVLATLYFDELGYFDIYKGVLLADEEGSRHFSDVEIVRDLHSYKPTSRAEALQEARDEGFRERFSDARWARFQRDVDTMFDYRRDEDWRGIFRDLGYNPSPAWLVVHRPLLNAVGLQGGLTLEVAAAAQIIVFAAAFGAAWWGFGLRAMLWLALWTALFFGNRGRLIGGYFTYDWLALAVIPAALAARGRAALAAPFVAYGGLMRGFGGLMAIGPTVHFLRDAWRERRAPVGPARFVAVLALCMAVVGAASLATPRGAGAWGEWKEKISLHSYRISAGGRHVGLKTLFGEDWAEPGSTEDMAARRRLVSQRLPAYRAVQGGLVLWTLLAMRRRRPLDAMILGLIPAFSVMVLSRYYFATWVLFLLLGTTPERREPRLLAVLAMFGLLAQYHFLKVAGLTSVQGRFDVFNALVLVLMVATLAGYTATDLRARPGAGGRYQAR